MTAFPAATASERPSGLTAGAAQVQLVPGAPSRRRTAWPVTTSSSVTRPVSISALSSERPSAEKLTAVGCSRLPIMRRCTRRDGKYTSFTSVLAIEAKRGATGENAPPAQLIHSDGSAVGADDAKTSGSRRSFHQSGRSDRRRR